MSHHKRIIIPGIPLHICQRGVRRMNVFRDEEDRYLYLRLFKRASRMFDLVVYAYCLMTNHTHFVATPKSLDSVARTFHRVHSIYGAAFNEKYNLSGYVWEQRPKSTPLDDNHFLAAVRYVERNPLRAGMVTRAEEYAWSSAAFHCGVVGSNDLLETSCPNREAIANWSEWLNGTSDHALEEVVRSRTLSGKPCGDTAFVIQLEERLGRRIAPRKRGRKPRNSGGAPKLL